MKRKVFLDIYYLHKADHSVLLKKSHRNKKTATQTILFPSEQKNQNARPRTPTEFFTRRFCLPGKTQTHPYGGHAWPPPLFLHYPLLRGRQVAE